MSHDPAMIAAARSVFREEAPGLFRDLLKAEMSNGWGDYRRLVVQELERAAKERGTQQVAINNLENTVGTQTAILERLEKRDEKQEETVIDLRIQFAKSAAKWGAISGVVGSILIILIQQLLGVGS